jgi:hypothetical protein
VLLRARLSSLCLTSGDNNKLFLYIGCPPNPEEGVTETRDEFQLMTMS